MNSSINPLSSPLQQMQTMATQAAGGAGNIASGSVEQQSGVASVGSFADALKSSLDNISSAQKVKVLVRSVAKGHCMDILILQSRDLTRFPCNREIPLPGSNGPNGPQAGQKGGF